MKLVKLVLIVACYSFCGILFFDYSLPFIVALKYGEILYLIYFLLYFFVVFLVLAIKLLKQGSNLALIALILFITFLTYQYFFRLPGDWNLAWQRSLLNTFVSMISIFVGTKYRHRLNLL